MKKFTCAFAFVASVLPALAEEVTLSEPTDVDPFWADRNCIEDVIRDFTAWDQTIFANGDLQPEWQFGQITGYSVSESTFREFSVTFDDEVLNQVQIIALRHDFTTTSPFAIGGIDNAAPYSTQAQHLLSPDASVIGLTGYFSSISDETGERPALGYDALGEVKSFTQEVLGCSNMVLG